MKSPIFLKKVNNCCCNEQLRLSPCFWGDISVVTLEYYLLFVISAGILLIKCENFTASFSLLKVCFNFCLSNTIWHYYIIYLPMNKIFQLCFMFSQEIYIKLGTLPSHKMKIFVKKYENLSESEVQMLEDHVVCRLLWWSSGPHLTYGFLQPQLKCKMCR